MVYYHTAAELNTAFAPMVGRCDYMDHIHRPDSSTALQLAHLQEGQSVLELGAGSGRFIAAAKQRVGPGFCVAVDAVQGFLSSDIPWTLAANGLSVYPASTPARQVHLLQANINDPNLVGSIRALPGAPPTFDCIVALHLFNTLPANQRRQALVRLRQLLSSTGRLILTMSARFTDIPPSPAEVNVPVQFRTTGHTEAPGSNVLTAFKSTPLVQVPQGGQGLASKVVTMTLQVAPDRFWGVAAAQAVEAATDAGFLVHATRHIGKGNAFGLPYGENSPPQSALNAMPPAQLANYTAKPLEHGTFNCIGRTFDTLVRRQYQGWDQLTPEARDYTVVMNMQSFVLKDKQRVLESSDAFLPANGTLSETLDFPQVGVMLVLIKM